MDPKGRGVRQARKGEETGGKKFRNPKVRMTGGQEYVGPARSRPRSGT